MSVENTPIKIARHVIKVARLVFLFQCAWSNGTRLYLPKRRIKIIATKIRAMICFEIISKILN